MVKLKTNFQFFTFTGLFLINWVVIFKMMLIHVFVTCAHKYPCYAIEHARFSMKPQSVM